MIPTDATLLIHLVGFMTGIVLYAMLGAMTLRAHRWRDVSTLALRGDRIPLATALLGLAWNSGALVIYGLRDLGVAAPAPVLTAFAFSALGFLPAVVVHSAFPTAARARGGWTVVWAAYLLSTIASVMQLRAALRHDALPWRPAMVLLTVGYLAIIGLLVVYSSLQPTVRRALSAVALAAFAVMALHLGRHATSSDTWPIELVGHHASLPLALVILYQDYRFALADLFLKRALTLLALIGVWMALYVAVAVPYVLPRMAGDWTQPLGVGALLGMGVMTAIAYPTLRVAVGRFVDRVVLRRVDYRHVRTQFAAAAASLGAPNDVLGEACAVLGPALSASRVSWRVAGDDSVPVDWQAASGGRAPGTSVRVPTTEAPAYLIDIGPLTGGRRLMSDDIALLERVALAAARRIDSIRVSDERYTRDAREREMQQLATQAELKALRAQLNPHFLFNALTTIGQLIQEAPDRAVTTLFRLTALLRAVLRRAEGEFTTVADEIQIVRAYLDIERARFEDALRVSIEVDDAVRACRIPSLLLQPLAENAVKHGIAPRVGGGAVSVHARLDPPNAPSRAGAMLVFTVRDTGVGVSARDLAHGRANGIGLSTVARRLERCYGPDASLEIRSTPNVGTDVTIRVPLPGIAAAGAA
ncbi:MAG TPA: histidine kinase [Gemmatimonadaceae bacterium]|jgi:two-component system LytT family sensor kinase